MIYSDRLDRRVLTYSHPVDLPKPRGFGLCCPLLLLSNQLLKPSMCWDGSQANQLQSHHLPRSQIAAFVFSAPLSQKRLTSRQAGNPSAERVVYRRKARAQGRLADMPPEPARERPSATFPRWHLCWSCFSLPQHSFLPAWLILPPAARGGAKGALSQKVFFERGCRSGCCT